MCVQSEPSERTAASDQRGQTAENHGEEITPGGPAIMPISDPAVAVHSTVMLSCLVTAGSPLIILVTTLIIAQLLADTGSHHVLHKGKASCVDINIGHNPSEGTDQADHAYERRWGRHMFRTSPCPFVMASLRH
jgi:hypothetical protein